LDRSGRDADPLEAIGVNVSRFLQGLLVDADGRPILLSATGLHSALGKIRDIVVRSDVLRELVEALLPETAGQ